VKIPLSGFHLEKERIMGLFKRISDIITANLNEMTDGLEDPEKMLKQAVREMEQSITDATQETAKVLANEKLLVRELDSNRQQSLDWQSKAEQAIDAGDDGMARKALSRKQEHQKLVIALEDQLKLAQETTKTLKHQLDGMRAKMAEAKRNLATLSARKKAADFQKKVHTSAMDLEKGNNGDDAFAKFDRMKERVERAEAEAEALAELRGGPHTRDDSDLEITSSAADSLDAELAALKKKRNG
jgi:phage shock protein A